MLTIHLSQIELKSAVVLDLNFFMLLYFFMERLVHDKDWGWYGVVKLVIIRDKFRLLSFGVGKFLIL